MCDGLTDPSRDGSGLGPLAEGQQEAQDGAGGRSQEVHQSPLSNGLLLSETTVLS